MNGYCEKFFPDCLCNTCERKRTNPSCCIGHHRECKNGDPCTKNACKHYILQSTKYEEKLKNDH